jgi:hypothetical protein
VGGIGLLLAALLMVEVPAAETPPPRPYYLRTVLESSLLLALGAAWYWHDPNPNNNDLAFDWRSWRRKINLQAVRLDDNKFHTNVLNHPYAGAAYFQVARGNGLSFGGSYLSALLSSTFWEYVVEFQEAPSLNDLIMTPVAGAVMGESTFRLGRWFAARPPSLGNYVGQLALSPVATLNDWLGGETGRPPRAISRVPEHRLVLQAGAQTVAFADGQRRQEAAFVLDSALVSHPGYQRPGRSVTRVSPGQWSHLGGQVIVARDGELAGYEFHSHTVLLGRHFRAHPAGDGAARGREPAPGLDWLLALGSSFDYEARQLGPGWERLASVGLLGPVSEFTAAGERAALRATLAAYYSIGMVQSPIYARHGLLAVPERTRTTPLRSRGYYHAHGLTSAGSVWVRLRRLELALDGDLRAFWAIDGRDRFQETLQADTSLSDKRLRTAMTITFDPLSGPLRLTSRFEHLQRFSHAAGSSISATERRWGLGIAMVY